MGLAKKFVLVFPWDVMGKPEQTFGHLNTSLKCKRKIVTGFHLFIQQLFIECYTVTWRRHPALVLLPGKSHGRRSLVGYSPWGREESDTTEQLHFHFSLSCIGEGNGNPLQCFCLENPRDREAWWAAVYGVAQSQTWLKWLSSSILWQDLWYIVT